MLLSRNKKNNVYPYKYQFYYIKMRFKRVRLYTEACFRDEYSKRQAWANRSDVGRVIWSGLGCLNTTDMPLPNNSVNIKKSTIGSITKTHLFKYIEKFTSKNWKFSDKKPMIFFIFLLKTDCGYSLEPPRWGGSNEYPQSMFWAQIRKIIYTPVNPSFTIIKVEVSGWPIS